MNQWTRYRKGWTTRRTITGLGIGEADIRGPRSSIIDRSLIKDINYTTPKVRPNHMDHCIYRGNRGKSSYGNVDEESILRPTGPGVRGTLVINIRSRTIIFPVNHVHRGARDRKRRHP
jgi:hypothetical protein